MRCEADFMHAIGGGMHTVRPHSYDCSVVKDLAVDDAEKNKVARLGVSV